MIRNELDQACLSLLNDVEQYIAIDFVQQDTPPYGFQVTERTTNHLPKTGRVFYYQPINSAKIAHELLHAKIDYFLGNGMCIYKYAQNIDVLNSLFDYNMCADFTNQTAHKIFYKEYAAMGYSPENFVEGVHWDTQGWNALKLRWKKTPKENQLVDIKNFILAITHIMLFPIDNRFAYIEREMKHMERDLFAIFKKFRDIIETLQIRATDGDKMEQAYMAFIKDIHSWGTKNNIIHSK